MESAFDIPIDMDTPVSAFRKLAALEPCFLLESVEGGERLGRYSFIGLRPAFTVRLDHLGLRVDDDVRAAPTTPEELLRVLRALLASCPQLHPRLSAVPFDGGLVGAIGYGMSKRLECLPARSPISLSPDALLVAPTAALVFDHVTHRAALLSAGSDEERANLKVEVLKALSHLPVPKPARGACFEAHESLARSEFCDRVARAQDYIGAGEVFQLVLSVRFEGARTVDPFEVYRAMRSINPSPYLYFLSIGGTQLAGSSPEALVRLRGRAATLRPIAGTRPRGRNLADDTALEKELLSDHKEAAEHVMLVDLARNDLGRVAVPGSIFVEPSRTVERYSHVMHLVSGVSGKIEEGRDAFDLFRAAFPAGTLVGAPKIRAMELLEELEPVERGFYGGTVGYFARCGDMDQAIAIRTIVFEDGRYSYQAGAGVVADSRPDFEHQEVLAKVGALRSALRCTHEGLMS